MKIIHKREATRKGSRRALLALLVLMAPGLTFGGQKHKLSKDLEELKGGPEGATVDVIIQFNHAPTDAQHAKVQAKGGLLKTKLDVIKGAHYSVPVQSLPALADDPDVAYISPDRSLRGAMNYAVSAVTADIAHTWGWNGSGVGVAVIDSGVNPVWDLTQTGTSKTQRIIYSQNFDPTTNTTSDLYGHGTHVAGIIAGNGGSSSCGNCAVTFVGIAPSANIINLRVLDQNGSGTDSTVIAGIQAAISLKNAYNIRVINLSLGRGVFENYSLDPLCQAVEQAWNAGIVVVVAAGNYGRDNSYNNYGYGTITSPGIDPYVITVGAMKTMGTPSRSDDLVASYSSKGPTLFDHVAKPDIVAPGNLIVSDLASTTDTLFTSYLQNAVPVTYYVSSNTSLISSSYYRLSGTSMAAPMVSGAVALLLQQNPSLTPDQVKARLMKTTYKSFPQSSSYTDSATGITYTSQYDIFTIGAGYLDVTAALSNTDLAPATLGAAKSPTAAFNSSTGQVYLSLDPSTVWDSSPTWASAVVWGSGVIWGTTTSGQAVLWGSSVCWGSSTSSAFGVLWGTSLVWGTQTTSEAMSLAIGGDR